MRNFGSHIGQALLGEEINGVNFGENWISIDPAADYDETVAAIEEVVDGYPGLFRNVETYLNERIDEVLTGSSETFVVRIFGPDLKGIHDKADEVRAALKDIHGIVDLHVAAPDPRCRRSRSRSTWPRPSSMASNPAMCAGRRRP